MFSVFIKLVKWRASFFTTKYPSQDGCYIAIAIAIMYSQLQSHLLFLFRLLFEFKCHYVKHLAEESLFISLRFQCYIPTKTTMFVLSIESVQCFLSSIHKLFQFNNIQSNPV